MCWMVAIPMAMALGQQAMGGAQSNQAVAAQNDQSRRQALEMVKKLNYDDADAHMQAMDNLDTARQDLTVQSMTRVRNMGTIRAAIGEGNLEGNSMERVQRVTEGDMLREAQGITDNYNRDYAAIFAKQVGNRTGTVNQIKAMQASEGRVKGVLEQIVDPLGLGINKLLKVTDIGGRKIWANKAASTIQKNSDKANN